jgi:hypothetical protein
MGMSKSGGLVAGVARDDAHRFSKIAVPVISLLAGLGVEGDAHCGVRVRHRSRVRQDPTQPNLRQVHLLQSEIFDELRIKGFDIAPAEIGENITTSGIDLLALPTGTHLRIGLAVIEITGLRNPCHQLNDHKSGLTEAVLERDAGGRLIRKAGVMGIVIAGGDVRPGDAIAVDLPPLPHRALERI